jgi:hypothetical protein
MKKEYDFVFTCKPINKTASIVLGKGEYYEPQILMGQYHSDKPLPTKYFTGKPQDDLTGKKIGRLTAIGFLGKKGSDNNKKDGIWLVKCDCGCYETRKSKSLKKNINKLAHQDQLLIMCRVCMDLENLKRRYNKY